MAINVKSFEGEQLSAIKAEGKRHFGLRIGLIEQVGSRYQAEGRARHGEQDPRQKAEQDLGLMTLGSTSPLAHDLRQKGKEKDIANCENKRQKKQALISRCRSSTHQT